MEDATGDVLWGLGDHEGTIRDLIDSTGTVQEHRQYDAFGQIVSPAVPTADFPQAFTGRALDADTNLYDYLARWYDPAVGRFVSEDPSGFAGGDANLYRYAGNSPLVNVDPSGLCFTGIVDSARDKVKGLLENDLLMAAMEVGGSFLPGIGEAMDMGVLIAADSTMGERLLAIGSLGLSIATAGVSPNFGAYLRATKRLGKFLDRADQMADVGTALARGAGRGADDVATGLARAAGRGADDVATGLAKTPRRTAADRVRRFLADESGSVPIPGGQTPNATKALTQAEQRAIGKIDNAIRDHLKPHDYTGTLRDMVGHPVPKHAGGYFDHVKEMNDTLRGYEEKCGIAQECHRLSRAGCTSAGAGCN